MRLSCLGSTNTLLCQIGALREGFAALGHEHTPNYADANTAFVFVGNSPYDSYLPITRAKKVIFNVLDCPTWVPDWPAIRDSFRANLPQASRVTCISKTVQHDLRNLCGVKAEVIYYPMKPVRFTGGKRYPQFKAAMVGRLCDPGKRAALGIQALIRAGYNETEVAMVGPEYPGWGSNLGVVSDEALTDLFNSVDYVLMTSRHEGIGLPAIEAACCGAIPIVLPDLSTYNEFWAESPLGLQYQQLTSSDDIAKLLISLNGDAAWKAAAKRDILAYAETRFRPLSDRIEVAKRILSVYQNL